MSSREQSSNIQVIKHSNKQAVKRQWFKILTGEITGKHPTKSRKLMYLGFSAIVASRRVSADSGN